MVGVFVRLMALQCTSNSTHQQQLHCNNNSRCFNQNEKKERKKKNKQATSPTLAPHATKQARGMRETTRAAAVKKSK